MHGNGRDNGSADMNYANSTEPGRVNTISTAFERGVEKNEETMERPTTRSTKTANMDRNMRERPQLGS